MCVCVCVCVYPIAVILATPIPWLLYTVTGHRTQTRALMFENCFICFVAGNVQHLEVAGIAGAAGAAGAEGMRALRYASKNRSLLLYIRSLLTLLRS